MIYVGNDPGKEGWIAWVNETGKLIGMARQPLLGEGKGDTYDRQGMSRLVWSLRDLATFNKDGYRQRHLEGPSEVGLWLIERQEPVGGAGRKNPVSIATQFQSYGSWLGVLAALEVRHSEIRPVDWQAAVGISRPAVRTGVMRGRNPGKLVKAAQLTPELEAAQAKERRAAKDKQRKEILANIVRRAQTLFPDVRLLPTERCTTPSPDMAAALLLAELARRQALSLAPLRSDTTPETLSRTGASA